MSAVLSTPACPELSFVALREHDLFAVAAIESDVYVFPWTIGNFRDSVLSAYECWGCWACGELIGYAIVMTALEEAHLLNFAVASKWQRCGVGKALLRFLIDRAAAGRLDVIYLEVRPSNLAGLRLYEQFGFKQLGVRKDYYPAMAGREDALFLGLSIVRKIL
ncbi:MAG: ribosomal protein S18-alanine N-acetyltransferase [Burkholderiales bacterium]|nr:ribosomal protein S18-alanine N-acetyltransferase [Burkholderiales bacterium]